MGSFRRTDNSIFKTVETNMCSKMKISWNRKETKAFISEIKHKSLRRLVKY